MFKINKKVKYMTVAFVSLFAVTTISGCSCTNSMCTSGDEQSIKAAIEKEHISEWRNTAALSNMKVETDEYVAYANAKVEELYTTSECGLSGTCTSEEISATKAEIKKAHNDEWLNALESLDVNDENYIETRTTQFKEYVDEQVNSIYETHSKACLVVKDDIDPQTGAKIEKKTWGDAWKTGLLEGLIVYPIGWLLSVLTDSFGGSGGAQLLAILIAVIIIRLLMLILNFKGQISTIKMQSVQGEMNEISTKLKDPNLTEREKQALSLKMMDIYKKNDIHPFASILSQFISFPIFIAVWAAMNQTLAIRKGTLFGLSFGETISTQIFDGNIAAIILFVLMIAGQIVTMKLSSWLKIRKEKKKNPHYKKPEKTDAEKQMNIMMTVMISMVVVSGFVLPAALVIYWLFGSIFSIAQTLVFSTDFITQKLNGFANRKKKAKVVK